MSYENLIGKSYVFEDGNSITVSQVKLRDGNIPWVTYLTKSGPGIPRKYVTTLYEFNGHYGHLFGIDPSDIPDMPQD